MGEKLDYIKEELSKEEQLLEQVIRAEKFYKKYKKPLIALGIAFVLAIGGYLLYDAKVKADILASNQALYKLLQNPKNKEAVEVLKAKNPKLYELFLYHQALRTKDIKTLQKLQKSKNPIIADLATYHYEALKQEEQGLERYSRKEDALLKEYALLDSAFLAMRDGNIQKGDRLLSTILPQSPASVYGKLLRHYGVGK